MFLSKISHIYCLYSNVSDISNFWYNENNISYHKYDLNSSFKDKSYFIDALMYECILDAKNNEYETICFLYPDVKLIETECCFEYYNIFCLNPFDVNNDCIIINKMIIDYIASIKDINFSDYKWKEILLNYINSNFKIYYPNKNYVKHKFDYVLTYVNNNDQKWINQYKETFGVLQTNNIRFNDYGTLYLIILGIRKYCEFIDDIYIIVSNKSQLSDEVMNLDIKVVEHKEIIPDQFLPTFNSCTIEMFLGKIKGLSEYFIYGNDDMFFIDYCNYDNFFNKGKTVLSMNNITNDNSIYNNQCKNSFKLTLNEFNFEYFKHIKMSKYIKILTHQPHPIRKSIYNHIINLYNDEIYNSISKLREIKNFNQYIFCYYDYFINNTTNENKLNNLYFDKNSDISLLNDINNIQTICINNISDKHIINNIKNLLKTKIKQIKVVLCAIAKNENLYIREWVEYYKNLGITNIFLYDNNDIENGEYFEDVINDYINDGFVKVINVRGVWPAQVDCFNTFYNNYSMDYDWILYCDIDEFIEFSDKNMTIPQFVSNNKFINYDIIKVCWKCFDDNDLVCVKDNDYSIKRFTRPNKNGPYINSQTKMFIRPNRNAIINSPHGALTINGLNEHLKVCNVLGKELKRNNIAYSYNGIDYEHGNCWLNHYRFKTIEEYIIKSKRGWPTIYMNGGKEYMNARFFFMFNKYSRQKHKLFANLLERQYISLTTYGSILQNKNWGDDINFSFLQEITGYNYEFIHVNKNIDENNYACIGSIIDDHYLTKNTIIWGSGIPEIDTIISIKPKQILSVRGPLTRNKLLEQNIDCPEVYGDPALLIHKFYNPNIEKKYKLGIIPHFSNIKHEKIVKVKNNPNIKIIDLVNYRGLWKNVIDDILSCEYIISESLHGLIISEQYNIPNLWINISDNKSKNKGIFKYLDFYHSIGKYDIIKYTNIDNFTNLDYIINLINKKYYRKFDIDLDKLINSCPFNIKNDLLVNHSRFIDI